jgi:hypothetical protein
VPSHKTSRLAALMRRLILLGAVITIILVVPAQAQAVTCQVDPDISAADINAGGTWYWEGFGAANTWYLGYLSWQGDWWNPGVPNDDLETGPDGHGVTVHGQFLWGTNGALPGHFNMDGSYTVTPSAFKIRMKLQDSGGGGNGATCEGVVGP